MKERNNGDTNHDTTRCVDNLGTKRRDTKPHERIGRDMEKGYIEHTAIS